MSDVDQFEIFKSFQKNLEAGYTNKRFGSFKEGEGGFQENLKKIKLTNVTTSYQTHSDIILKIDHSASEANEGDALITNKKNTPIMVKVADCQGVLAYDPQKEVIAAIHSGWKGSVQNIIGKTIQRLVKEYDCDPNNLIVAISPSLGPCCCEFTDPKKELPSFCHPYVKANNHVDFWEISLKQCLDEGIKAENIQKPTTCTKCDKNYFSHRRQEKGRMAVYIKMK